MHIFSGFCSSLLAVDPYSDCTLLNGIKRAISVGQWYGSGKTKVVYTGFVFKGAELEQCFSPASLFYIGYTQKQSYLRSLPTSFLLNCTCEGAARPRFPRCTKNIADGLTNS